MLVQGAVDHRALEAILGDRALELVGRGLGIGRWADAERLEAALMGAAGLVEAVIGLAGESDSALGVHLLHRGRAMRQHLNIDAGLVHLLDAQLAEVAEPLGNARRRTGARIGGRVKRLHLGVQVMLFEGDDERLLGHECLH